MADGRRGFYEVEMRVPGDMSWCLETKASFDEWMAALAESEQSSGLGAMPAIRIDAGSGHGELVLSWIEVVADGPWAAVREIGGIAETTFPELLRKAAALSVVATLQDPDRERRRPLGA